jgi:hypothetical protein
MEMGCLSRNEPFSEHTSRKDRIMKSTTRKRKLGRNGTTPAISTLSILVFSLLITGISSTVSANDLMKIVSNANLKAINERYVIGPPAWVNTSGIKNKGGKRYVTWAETMVPSIGSGCPVGLGKKPGPTGKRNWCRLGVWVPKGADVYKVRTYVRAGSKWKRCREDDSETPLGWSNVGALAYYKGETGPGHPTNPNLDSVCAIFNNWHGSRNLDIKIKVWYKK